MSKEENKKNIGLKVAALVAASAAAAAAYFRVSYEVFKKTCIKGTTHFGTSDNGLIVRKSNSGWLSTIAHQNLSITSDDGLLLHGTYIPSENASNEWIVLVHGYDADSTQMLPLAKTYHAHGYQIVIPDLRCHGTSEGEVISFGAKESDDLCGWMDLILQMDPNAKIILHGISMGASTSLLASSKVMHTALKGVISDCGYTSYQDVLRHLTTKIYHIPGSVFVPGVSFWIKKIGHFTYQDCDCIQAICMKAVPTLFFHGANDTFIPTEMVNRLANALQNASIVEIVENAGHAQCMYDNKYMSKCLLFVQKQMFNG